MTRAKKTRTATRKCATCGESFTWTSRNPKRRFCDPICKARWWRASNNGGPRTPATAGHPDTVTVTASPSTASTAADHVSTDHVDTASTANAVTQSFDPYVSGYRTDQAPSGVQNCPNCHQPVAVINLLVAPAAAYVNTPSRSVTNHS
ncbi:hypothetical protein [Nonomuraea sp. NPDC052265]|uniref:hypothetical protein n=1 Tax=Nonomuraea sp. NPDC052265 TaxID=3364374 RepID=UPI0037CC8257